MAKDKRVSTFNDIDPLTKKALDESFNQRVNTLNSINEENFNDSADISGQKLETNQTGGNNAIGEELLKVDPKIGIQTTASIALTTSWQELTGTNIELVCPIRQLVMFWGVFDIDSIDVEVALGIKDVTNSTSTVTALLRNVEGNSARITAVAGFRATILFPQIYLVEPGIWEFALVAKELTAGTANTTSAHTRLIAIPFSAARY